MGCTDFIGFSFIGITPDNQHKCAEYQGQERKEGITRRGRVLPVDRCCTGVRAPHGVRKRIQRAQSA